MRDDLMPGLRVVGYRRTVTVAFTVDDDTVSIAAIFYGVQDYEVAFLPSDEDK